MSHEKSDKKRRSFRKNCSNDSDKNNLESLTKKLLITPEICRKKLRHSIGVVLCLCLYDEFFFCISGNKQENLTQGRAKNGYKAALLEGFFSEVFAKIAVMILFLIFEILRLCHYLQYGEVAYRLQYLEELFVFNKSCCN